MSGNWEGHRKEPWRERNCRWVMLTLMFAETLAVICIAWHTH
jgi:hypothetical protein